MLTNKHEISNRISGIILRWLFRRRRRSGDRQDVSMMIINMMMLVQQRQRRLVCGELIIYPDPSWGINAACNVINMEIKARNVFKLNFD